MQRGAIPGVLGHLLEPGRLPGPVCGLYGAEIASGYWDRLFYWLSLWLVIVCTVLSSWEVVRTILQTWVKNRSLELKDQLVMENYRSLEERLREEAAVRHESSHRLAALRPCSKRGIWRACGKTWPSGKPRTAKPCPATPPTSR